MPTSRFRQRPAPAQIRNLERQLEVKVLDRTEVILDIFAAQARTYESRLRRAAQLRIRDASAEADVDPPVALEDGHRRARPW